MGKALDLTGKKFGRLAVTGKTNKRSKCGFVIWKCICICGKKCLVAGSDLKTKHTQSCGCLQRERAKQANSAYTRGGHL